MLLPSLDIASVVSLCLFGILLQPQGCRAFSTSLSNCRTNLLPSSLFWIRAKNDILSDRGRTLAHNRNNFRKHHFVVDVTTTKAEVVAGRFDDAGAGDSAKKAKTGTGQDMDIDEVQQENMITDLNADTSAPVIGGEVQTPPGSRTPSFPVVLWKFTRPHTLIGSALAIPALHILAAPYWSAAFTVPSLLAMLYAMVPALLMNLYITGLNQITDVEIDKVNKPNLPIAAGYLSVRKATIIVIVSLLASLVMGMIHPRFGTEGLNVALWGSGILGTLYSLPPIRLKRFPVLAAFCIVAVRGFIINASFFAHSAAAAYGIAGPGGSAGFSSTIIQCLMKDRACFLSSSFFAVFGLVIALMKDVPDVIGDLRADVRTFSVRLGQKTVFHGMRWLLSGLFFTVGGLFLRAAYMAVTSTATTIQPAGFMSLAVARVITACFAIGAGVSVRQQAQGVDPENSQQVYGYYMHLWKLFYLSYFALPFAR